MSSQERDFSLASTTHISTGIAEATTMNFEKDEKLIQMRRKRGPLPRVEIDFVKSDLRRHRNMQIATNSHKIRREKKVAYAHEPNHVVSFEDRLAILHLYKAHRMSACDIAKVLGKKYSTIRSIVLTYDKCGRINKLLTLSAKKIILDARAHRETLLPPKRKDICSSTVTFNLKVDDAGNEKMSIIDS